MPLSLERREESLAIQERLAAEDPTDEYVIEELAALRPGVVPPEAP